MKPFFGEFTHDVAFAFAVTLLVVGWLAMFKVVTPKLPLPSGIAELFAGV